MNMDEVSSVLKVRYCKRCNEMLSPNHDYCIRCGYSEKDAIAEGSVSNELVDRINRLETILARLANRFSLDVDDNGNDNNNNNNNNTDSKRRKKGKVIV